MSSSILYSTVTSIGSFHVDGLENQAFLFLRADKLLSLQDLYLYRLIGIIFIKLLIHSS